MEENVFSNVFCKKNFNVKHVVGYTYFLYTSTYKVVDSNLIQLECALEKPSFNFLYHMEETSSKWVNPGYF